MPIVVSLPGDRYEPVEPSTWKDVTVFCFVIAASVYFISVISLMLFNRTVRKYAPLRIRNLKKLIGMKVFSLIHIWSAFLASDYFDFCRAVEQSSCVFWNYWLPFSIGLGGWFAIFVLRLFDFISLFKVVSVQRRRMYRGILFVTMIAPPLILSTVITATRSSYLSQEGHAFCNSNLTSQLSQLVYISVYLIIVFSFMVVIKLVIHRESVLNEYHALSNIAVSGFQVLAITAFVQIYDGMQSSWGRFVFGVCLVSIHLYASLKLCGNELYYALKNDQTYLVHFLENETKAASRMFPPSLILDVPSIRLDFINWCSLPGNMPLFFRDIEYNWKSLWSDPRKLPSESLVQHTFKKILNEYLVQDGSRHIPELDRLLFATWFQSVDTNRLHPFSFNLLETNLLQPFIAKRAAEYLKIMEERSFFTIETKRRLAEAQRAHLMSQLESEKLISRQMKIPSFREQFVELLEIF